MNIYIIAGPNGAGKTTLATEYLPKYIECREFLNADLIAAGLSPFSPALQNFRASELMVERMQNLLEKRQSFAFETTLAARSYTKKIPQWRAMGYCVKLIFIWVPTVGLAIDRVANRVKQGGHDVPQQTIERRYRMGLLNFRHLYCPIVDEWMVVNGSEFPPTEIARKEDEIFKVIKPKEWRHFEQQLQHLELTDNE